MLFSILIYLTLQNFKSCEVSIGFTLPEKLDKSIAQEIHFWLTCLAQKWLLKSGVCLLIRRRSIWLDIKVVCTCAFLLCKGIA